MRVLFDHNTPAPLRSSLKSHHVETAYARGWSKLLNGDLLAAAEAGGFELLITSDRGFQYQQNWARRKIGLLILSTNDWTRIRSVRDQIANAVDAMEAGQFAEFEVP